MSIVVFGEIQLKTVDGTETVDAFIRKRTENGYAYISIFDKNVDKIYNYQNNRLGFVTLEGNRIRNIQNESNGLKQKKVKLVGTYLCEGMIATCLEKGFLPIVSPSAISQGAEGWYEKMGFLKGELSDEAVRYWKKRIVCSKLKYSPELIEKLKKELEKDKCNSRACKVKCSVLAPFRLLCSLVAMPFRCCKRSMN